MLKINISLLRAFPVMLGAVLVLLLPIGDSASGQDTAATLFQPPAESTYVNGKLLDFIPNQSQTYQPADPPSAD